MAEQALELKDEKFIGIVADSGDAKKRFWVEQTYEGYDKNVAWWDLLDELWEGGKTFQEGRHLVPHRIEIGDDGKTTQRYDRRLEQSYEPYPLVSGLIEPLTDFVAAHPPTAAELPQDLADVGDVVEAADPGRSQDLTEQSLDFSEGLLRYGIYYRAVDTELTLANLLQLARQAGLEEPTLDRDGNLVVPESLRRELGDRGLPYSYLIHPSCVRWGRHDRAGALIEVIVTEERDRGATLQSGQAGRELVYWHRSTTEWGLYRIDEDEKEDVGSPNRRKLVQLDGGTFPKPRPVPVYIGRLRKTRSPWRGRSYVEVWALLELAAYNVASSLTFALIDQAATQVFARADLGHLDDDELKKAVARLEDTLGKPGMILDTVTEVGTIDKNFANAALMKDLIDDFQRWAFHQTGFRSRAMDSAAPESGVAQITQFQLVNATLARVGGVLGKSEVFALREFARLLGKDPAKVQRNARQYPKRYDTRSVSDLVIMRKELDGLTAPEVLNEMVVEILRKGWGDLPQEQLDKLVESARVWKPSESAFGAVERFGQEAAGGGPGGLPAGDRDADEEDNGEGLPDSGEEPAA